jgi:NAD(P)-dependent dehydrogenase (short-subunit alcohol dehydrogenase family)
MSIQNALVIGAGSGVGQATARALAAAGAHVSASGSERDATDPDNIAELLAEADADLVVVAAGARPLMAPIEDQSWESFSAPWNTDVRIAFEVGRAAVAQPLRPGSTVLIVSSGAGLNPGGSPMSGGYAGAKRTQMFLCHYLQRTADARDLGIRFVTVAPRQFLVGTAIGEAAAAAYGAEAGLPGQAYMQQRFPDPLDVDDVARAILAIVSDSDYREATVFDLTAGGLQPV